MNDDKLKAALVQTSAEGWIGIDAPFGFPTSFAESVRAWMAEGVVLDRSEPAPAWLHNAGQKRWNPVTRRITDAYIALRQHEARREGETHINWPLSAVVERITPTVLRAAGLLAALREGALVDRIGFESRIVEVYPAAALRLWGFSTKGYKDKQQNDARQSILRGLKERAPWLDLGGYEGELAESDDAIDALVCALVARLASRPDRCTAPEKAGMQLDTDEIATEGWIHLPPTDDLAMLLF
jgi:predicted nuclease with RNAse H fold